MSTSLDSAVRAAERVAQADQESEPEPVARVLEQVQRDPLGCTLPRV
ncbi:hypothetical protein [Candidatus Spongiihabitans sp.]